MALSAPVTRPRSPTPSGHGVPQATLRDIDIVVLIPCFNEEASVGTVIGGFREALPGARIYVYDNNSQDGTSAAGYAAGAIVRHERQQGKGNVVTRMFADIDADVYVLVDGDDTYDASTAPMLVRHLVEHRLDLINGLRSGAHERRFHRFGNRLFNRIVAHIFGNRFDDMLSGYKVFSRRFVKSFPSLASGFEIETELTVHALRLSMPVAELPTRYRARPAAASKLRTVRDGLRILWAIVRLIKGERPLAFFSAIAAALAAVSLGLALPIAIAFAQTGLVPRLPTAVLAMGIMLLAFLSLACGFILDTVTRGRTEAKRLFYLLLPGPGE